jgi:hypothetical protein
MFMKKKSLFLLTEEMRNENFGVEVHSQKMMYFGTDEC